MIRSDKDVHMADVFLPNILRVPKRRCTLDSGRLRSASLLAVQRQVDVRPVDDVQQQRHVPVSQRLLVLS